jgi:hypothetical protein
MASKGKPAVTTSGPEQKLPHLAAFNDDHYTADSPTLANPALREAHHSQVACIYAELASEAWRAGQDRDARRYERRCWMHQRFAAAAESLQVKLEAMGVQL